MTRRILALAAAGCLLAGCGSTVQLEGQVQAPGAGDGLSAPTVTGDGQAIAPGTGGPLSQPGSASGPGSTTTVPGSTTPSGAQAPRAGGTQAVPTNGPRVTGPVTIGFVNTKVGNAGNAGLEVGQTYSTDQVFRALVNAMNARGGLVGRKILPVTAESDTASADWNTQFQAACDTFTRDNEVSAVVGYVFGFFDGFESCLAKAGVVHLNGAYTVGDEQDLRRYPTLFATSTLTADRRYLLQAAAAVREGWLTRESKLGLLLDECANDQRAVKNTLEPYLKAQGITVADRRTFSCAGGAGDVGPAASQVQAAVLAFRQRGVDRVFVEGIPTVLFAQTAESQGYRPGYLVTSTSPGSALEPNMPQEQAKNVHGYGWLPEVDVSLSKQPPKTAPQKRCLELLASQQVRPTQYNDFLNAYTACDGLFLYERALQLTNGSAATGSVVAALGSLGTSYPGVGVYGGKTSISRDRRSLPTTYRPWAFSAGCSCFDYTGGELPLP